MTDDERDSLINRVKKILSKTEDAGCTPEEAAAAYAKAQALMVEHNLSLDEVDGGGDDNAMADAEIGTFARWSNDHTLAAHVCTKFFFVKGWKRRVIDGRKSQSTQYFFGTRENVETARWVYLSLLEAFRRLWSEYRRRNPWVPGTDRRVFVLGVCRGFIDKLDMERQADAMERDILAGGASGGTELALANVEARVVAAFDAAHGTMKQGRSMRFGNGSRSSLEAGYAEGQRLELRRGLGGKGKGKSDAASVRGQIGG